MAYMSEEGYKKLMAELKELETVERPKISAAIAEARDKGDLSENAEYDAAKEAQGMLEMRINKLKAVIADAKIIDESKLKTDSVQILNKVELKNVKNGMKMTYTIVSESEANLKEGKISVNTPIAQGLLGKKVGDVAEITVPQGKIALEVVKGHTLVVPKQEVDYIFDLSDEDLAAMHVFAKQIARAIEKAFPCKKVGEAVIGLEVPHAHIHLIPIQKESDMLFSNPKLKLSDEEFKSIAQAINSSL